MSRPPLEVYRRRAERGIVMEIPQANDFLGAIDYALFLEGLLRRIQELPDRFGHFSGADAATEAIRIAKQASA